MARIKYPTDFLKRTELFLSIKKKHDEDGAASPLIPFLNQHNIDLGADEAATVEAIKKDDLFDQSAKNAEEATEVRNNSFNPVFGRLRGSVQYLKKFYKGNEKELGTWGVRVDRNRIVYPADFMRRAELFGNFKKRHDELGAASPLTTYLSHHNIDLEKDEGNVNKAAFNHGKAEQAAKNAEDFREGRDKLFNPVFDHVRGMGQFLKALYVKNPKELGHWGYTVDDSPRKGRKARVMILPGGKLAVRRLLNGKELTNTGNAELVLHKGRAEGKAGITLSPGESFIVKHGWGITTVVNTEQAQIATISVEKIS